MQCVQGVFSTDSKLIAYLAVSTKTCAKYERDCAMNVIKLAANIRPVSTKPFFLTYVKRETVVRKKNDLVDIVLLLTDRRTRLG